MSHPLSCEDFQRLLFDLRRDELSALKRAEASQHQHHCGECRELFTAMKALLDAAADDDPQVWTGIDADRLFEGVEAELRADSSARIDEPRARLEEMIEASRSESDELRVILDAESLFDRIESAIDEPSSDDDEAEATLVSVGELGTGDHEVAEPQNDDRENLRPSWHLALVGSLAVACAALLIWWWGGTEDASPTAPQSIEVAEIRPSHLGAIDDEFDEQGETEDEKEEGEVLAHDDDDGRADGITIGALERVSPKHEGVQLFTSEDADYEVADDDRDYSVQLNRGSVLVEYLPGETSTFTVSARAHSISVVGTVFYVEIKEETLSVAVVEGAVRVTDPNGETNELESGEFIAGDGRGALAEAVASQVERYIDLEAHRRALRQASTVATPERTEPTREPTEPAQEPEEVTARAEEPTRKRERDVVVEEQQDAEPEAEEVGPVSVRELRESALESLHRGDHRQAVEVLGQALQKTDATDHTRADILLELARIHLHDLDEPRQAADYLDRFLAHWPEDPAADSIRKQLCDMNSIDRSDAALCEPF